MTPGFTDWIRKVAVASGRTFGDVLAMWHEYCRDCTNYDQSPVKSEFCAWYKLVEVA